MSFISKNTFRNDWSDSRESFEDAFEETIDRKVELLLCTDTSESYEGQVDIIGMIRNGYRSYSLFEVSSGHCSCNGHEGGWRPGEVTLESLKLRKDYPGMTEDEWQKFLTHLEGVLR